MITAADLQTTLVTILAGVAGGEATHWRELVGEVVLHSDEQAPKSNWSVVLRGSDAEKATIAEAVEIVRAQHPYVGR